MDLRTLRYFIAVLEAGSLSRAAGSLYVAQPALTAQIKKLEAELGTQLFDRSHAGVTPTPAGMQLYEDARDSARVMALVVHPYIMGVPHRLKYYRMILEKIRARADVLFWTGEQILDWYLAQRPDALK